MKPENILTLSQAKFLTFFYVLPCTVLTPGASHMKNKNKQGVYFYISYVRQGNEV